MVAPHWTDSLRASSTVFCWMWTIPFFLNCTNHILYRTVSGQSNKIQGGICTPFPILSNRALQDRKAERYIFFMSCLGKKKYSHSSVKIIRHKTLSTDAEAEGRGNWQGNPQWLLVAQLSWIVYLMKHSGRITTLQAIRVHCSKVVHKGLVMTLQRFAQIWELVNIVAISNWSKPHNRCLSIQIHMHSLLLPHGVDLLRGDKNCQNSSSWSASSSGHSKTLDFRGTQGRGHSPDWNSDRIGRQSAKTAALHEVSQGTA